jgi:hypothetical protein
MWDTVKEIALTVKEIALTVVVVAVTFVVVTYVLAAGVNQLGYRARVADIEQLRADIALVNVNESEDVMGQITETNRLIAQMKQYNQMWWSDLAIPDGWDSVPFIKIRP